MTISNSSPLISLSKLGRLELLKTLFTTVHIPYEVYRETAEEEKAPAAQRRAIQNAVSAGFIKIATVSVRRVFTRSALMIGEQDVLNLALEQKATRLILDDSAARREARDLGMAAILVYTSDILKLASERGWLDYHEALQELKRQGELLPENG